MESMLYQEHKFLGGTKHFGCEIMEDKPHSGRPCVSKMEENVTNMRAFVKSDRRMTE
jgi:hypothetical protein